MNLVELKKEELKIISGGNDITDAMKASVFLVGYALGLICYPIVGAYQAGYDAACD